MAKRAFFILLCCFGAFQSLAQQRDSLKADSLKKGPAIELNTVVIRGQRPVIERRVDGIVFNVAGLPSIAGSDASDILRKVPMVSVDGGGVLSVRGSTRVKVLIDGKPSEIYASSVADALRAIRGEQIVKVEVITDPSSRYEAEGADAVINIITRRLRKDATNGNIGVVAGNRTESVMGDVHHQHGVLQLHGDAYYQRYWNRNGSVVQRDAPGVSLRQENESHQVGDYSSGGLNLLYSPDSLNTFNGSYRRRQFPGTTTSTANNYDTGGEIPAFLFRRMLEAPGRTGGETYALGFNGRSGDKKNDYALLALYAPSENGNDYTLQQIDQNNSLYSESFRGNNSSKDEVIQADYTRSPGNNLKWEMGARFTARNVHNNSRYAPDAGRSAIFTYTSRIYAAYTNLSKRLGKWGISGGLRYEKTALNATFKNIQAAIPAFGNLVPQALIQFAVDDRTSFKLSYAKKLVRPQVSYLDPTVNTGDSLTLQYGNPTLAPEVINRYQVSYTVNAPDLFRDLVLFFNDNRNTIENVRLPLSNGRFASTWQNVGKNRRLGLSATIKWTASPAFTLGATMTAQYVRLESLAPAIVNSGLMRQLVMNASYKLPRGYSIDFYGFFDAKNLRLQGYRSGWKFYNMTLNKKFGNERLNLSLRAETFLSPYTYIDEVIQASDYSQRQSFRYQNQNIRLSLSYKIGKKEIKTPQVTNIEQ